MERVPMRCLARTLDTDNICDPASNPHSSSDHHDYNTSELPNKVDKSVNYVNEAYFNGELDLSTKHVLREAKR